MICSAMPQAFVDSGIIDVSSPAAERGTLQHHYAEQLRMGKLEMRCPDDLDTDEWDAVLTATGAIDAFLKEEGTYESDLKQYREYLELEVAFDDWRSECFGTVDFVRLDIRLRKLYVFDYKFGRIGVPAKDNSQLMVYALATFEHLLEKTQVDFTNMLDEVVLGIAQPMVSRNLQTHTIATADLLEWDKEVLQPAQRKILDGKGEFVTGSHCIEKYCKVRRNCEAYNSQGADDMSDFVKTYSVGEYNGTDDITPVRTINSLSIEELSEVLKKAPFIEGVLSDAKDRAYELIDSGTHVPGFKIVEGQGKRVWTDEEAAETFLTNQKLKVDERRKTSLITLPQAEKLLKEQEKLDNPRTLARFQELTNYKPGKNVLVSEFDPRPAIVKQEHVDKEVEEMYGEEFDDVDALLAGIDEAETDEVDDIDALLASL